MCSTLKKIGGSKVVNFARMSDETLYNFANFFDECIEVRAERIERMIKNGASEAEIEMVKNEIINLEMSLAQIEKELDRRKDK
jgi:hypothetical protein